MEGGETQIKETAAAPNHATVDVAQLARSMGKKLEHFDNERMQQPTMQRVIPCRRQEDSSAYDPKIISIGPLHRDKAGLRPMEELKWRYLHGLRARCPGTNMDDFVRVVSARVKDIRGQYSEEFKDITDEDFVEMMVLDGCFILELMIKLAKEEEWPDYACLPGGELASPILLNDLLLLENQIPFFVLEALFEAMAPRTLGFTLPQLAHQFINMSDVLPPMPQSLISNRQFLHLLHLCHYFHVWPCMREEPSSRSRWQAACNGLRTMRRMVSHAVFQVCFRLFYFVVSCLICSSPGYSSFKNSTFPLFIPSVTKLKEAGVRFKRKELTIEEAHSFLKVTFSGRDGVFEIPFRDLHGDSNSQFRNLIAFEQCFHNTPEVGLYFTSYCDLMSKLVETESDVGILEEHGIIFNFTGSSSEAAKFFDKVHKGATLSLATHHFAELLEQVNEYCESDVHRWRARLMRDYFGNPWAIISVVAAAVLLGLQILQTFYTVHAYYHPR